MLCIKLTNRPSGHYNILLILSLTIIATHSTYLRYTISPIVMARGNCINCHHRFASQSSLTRHIRHSRRCLYVWNAARLCLREGRREHLLREKLEEQVRDLPGNNLELIQSAFNMALYAPFPGGHDVEDDIDDIALAGKEDYDNVLGSEELEAYDGPNPMDIDPEAPLKYSKPGIFIESKYHSMIIGYCHTPFEMLKMEQLESGRSALYPFQSFDKYQLVRFMKTAGLTNNDITEMLGLKFVSEIRN